MRCWLFAVIFGIMGLLLGKVVSSNVGNNHEPVLMIGGAVTFAILGAILGGVRDIVQAIRSNRKPCSNAIAANDEIPLVPYSWPVCATTASVLSVYCAASIVNAWGEAGV